MRRSVFDFRYLFPFFILIIGCLYVIYFPEIVSLTYPLTEKSSDSIKTYGVLDRFLPTGEAVILLEQYDLQVLIPRERLPKDSEESTYFTIHIDDQEVSIQGIDKAKTFKEKQKAEKLQEKYLHRKSPSVL